MAVRACVIVSLRSASASHASSPLRIAASRPSAASATRNAPIARAEPFSVCASAAGVGGQGGESSDQTDRLGRKHRQHLAFEAGIAKRHPPEMLDIDRTVIGSERRRWHPVNPFQMKRHGDNPDLPAPSIRQRSFRQPITEMVNGTFWPPAAGLPCFWQRVAAIGGPDKKFCGFVRPYRAVLLTMIKNALIAAISFASPSQ